MSYKVLIVDDSNFFQMRLKEIVNEHPQLNVVGVAANGQEAIDLAAKLKPDVISMDYEMPFLDGVSAVKIIMDENPVPIVMFSSMTYEGAKITLDALEAGAVDFMNKNFAEVSNNSAMFKKKLHEKLITFAKSSNVSGGQSSAPEVKEPAAPPPQSRTPAAAKSRPAAQPAAKPAPSYSPPPQPSAKKVRGKIKLLAIGASTGGPVALSEIISSLPESFPVPVVIIQHMPENFTKAFAERMNRQSKLNVKEAQNGDRVERGQVLVAPGGKQMIFDKSGNAVKIIEGDDRVNYKPCVDISFASAANIFSDGVLGVVLTGMGADGCEGARLLKQRGSTIWSQDRESCVVYGMPAAVAKASLTDCVLPLKDVAKKLISDL